MFRRIAKTQAVLGILVLGALALALTANLQIDVASVSPHDVRDRNAVLPLAVPMSPDSPLEAQRNDAHQERVAVGRLVWSDGVPVAGARVKWAGGGPSTTSSSDGAFHLKVVTDPERTTIQLIVHPGCWCDPAPMRCAVPLLRVDAVGDNEQLSPYSIPAEADVKLRVSIDSATLALLRRVGHESIYSMAIKRDQLAGGVRNEVSAFFTGKTTLGHVVHRLGDVPTSDVIRVPLHEHIEVYARAVPSDTLIKLGEVTSPAMLVTMDRRSVPQVDIRMSSSSLISGRVIDQDGYPISKCTVFLPRLEVGPLGPRHVTTNDDGWFVASGVAGDTHAVWASYHGIESDRIQAAVGTVDIEIRCATARLRRVTVTRGPEPLKRFELSNNHVLFGKYTWPWLPSRPNGVAYLPRRARAEPRYLCWNDGAGYQEMPILVPGMEDAPDFRIDVANMNPEARGVLYVENAEDGPMVSLSRMEPQPLPGFRRLSAAALPWKEAPLLGILAGTYEVRIGGNPLVPPLVITRIELIAGENRIRVTDLLQHR